jgi:hypothetical protein
MLAKITNAVNGFTTRYFHAILAFLCLAYFALNTVYLRTMPLIMDEFSGANTVFQFSRGIPYVDFTPYKTILGYYIQLPALMLPGDIWSKLMYVKWEMVLLNGAALFAAAHMLSRHFKRPAILLAALMFLTMSNFLEHGAALRVDMMTAWFGLFSLLFLLRGRMIVSGLLLAASFLTSQKGVYYVAATILAMGLSQLVPRERPRFKQWLQLGFAAAIPVALYGISFVPFGAKTAQVAQQVVVAHKAIALDDLYREKMMTDFWKQTLVRNPFFYAGMALGILVSLFRAFKEKSRTAAICCVYGAAILAGCILHKQTWPYFFSILIPTAWVCICALIDGALSLPPRAGRPIAALLALAAIGGAAYPLQRVPVVLARSDANAMQKDTVALADFLVRKDDFYLAGIAILFDRKQPNGLSWLDWRAIAMRNRDRKGTLESLRQTPPKIYINNYRIRALHPAIRAYLRDNYALLKGNVSLYCPTIAAGPFSVAYDGNYIVHPPRGGGELTVDGRPLANGQRLALKKGAVHQSGSAGFRACLQPPEGWQSVISKDYKKTDEFYKPYEY